MKLLHPKYQDRQQRVIIFQTTAVENGQHLARAGGEMAEQAWGWLQIHIFSEQENAGSGALPGERAFGNVLHPRKSREDLKPESA